MLPWQPIFDRQFFQKMKNPFFLKWRKFTFFTVAFMFLAHISVPLLVLINFCSILVLLNKFLKFWGNPEIQYAHHGQSHHMMSSLPVADLTGNILRRTICFPSLIVIAFIFVK